MIPTPVLIQSPNVDFATFLTWCREALGMNPAAEMDASPIQRTDAERFLACLAKLQNSSVLAPNLYRHVAFGVLFGAEERDVTEILQLAGLPFVVVETISQNIVLCVLSGTGAAWRDAVRAGCARHVSYNTRIFFNRVMVLLETAGMRLWEDCHKKTWNDKTLLLEDKRP